MRHHMYNPGFKFVVEPEHFNKYTDRELLQYCLGATMYMPGFKDFTPKILNNSIPGLTTIVLCFEDACPEEKVPEAMENVHHLLATVTEAVENGALDADKVPLIFVRIRNLAQFKAFGERLTKQEVKSLCGINFPKFNAENGYEYYAYLQDLNDRFGEILYGMPIIEDAEVAYKVLTGVFLIYSSCLSSKIRVMRSKTVIWMNCCKNHWHNIVDMDGIMIVRPMIIIVCGLFRCMV